MEPIVKRNATWGADGESYLPFTNPQPVDGVVVVTQNNSLGIAIYMRPDESYKLASIATGSYRFWYVIGKDWDVANARSTRNAEYHKFILPMTFSSTLNPTTSTYTYWNTPLTAGNDDMQ